MAEGETADRSGHLSTAKLLMQSTQGASITLAPFRSIPEHLAPVHTPPFIDCRTVLVFPDLQRITITACALQPLDQLASLPVRSGMDQSEAVQATVAILFFTYPGRCTFRKSPEFTEIFFGGYCWQIAYVNDHFPNK